MKCDAVVWRVQRWRILRIKNAKHQRWNHANWFPDRLCDITYSRPSGQSFLRYWAIELVNRLAKCHSNHRVGTIECNSLKSFERLVFSSSSSCISSHGICHDDSNDLLAHYASEMPHIGVSCVARTKLKFGEHNVFILLVGLLCRSRIRWFYLDSGFPYDEFLNENISFRFARPSEEK